MIFDIVERTEFIERINLSLNMSIHISDQKLPIEIVLYNVISTIYGLILYDKLNSKTIYSITEGYNEIKMILDTTIRCFGVNTFIFYVITCH